MSKRTVVLIVFLTLFGLFSGGLFVSGLVMMLVGGKMMPQHGDVAVLKIEGEIFEVSSWLRQIEDLSEREDIKAVVLRLDSPGGLVSASQEIYRAVERLKKEKKVVASMGAVAASGAYYIACAADEIVANEGSITGSIGVKIEHVNVEELVALLRVKPRSLTTGNFKDMGSPLRPIRPDEEALFKDIIFGMHRQFKGVVAKDRKLTPEHVDTLADGRVYTGEEALKVGLIDSLGSLQDAIDVAAKLAGIKGKPKVTYPEPKDGHWMRYLVEESLAGFLKVLSNQRQASVRWQI